MPRIGWKKKQKAKLVDDYEETLSPGHSRARARMYAQRLRQHDVHKCQPQSDQILTWGGEVGHKLSPLVEKSLTSHSFWEKEG